MHDKTLFINNINKIEIKEDGSYIVIKNNIPYHIPNNNEYKEEYKAVKEYINENNINVTKYVEEENSITKNNVEETVRSERDYLLNQADIMMLKYNEQVELGVIPENNDYHTALLQYKQNLRDITKQIDFPNNVIFPVLPKYL